MPTLNEAFTNFLSHCCYEKGLNPKTLKFYGIDLRQFEEFLIKHNYSTQCEAIDKEIIRGYLQNLAAFKAKTIKRKIATLKSFLNYLVFEDEISASPFWKMRIKIKEPKVLPMVLTLSEIQKIFEVAYNNLKNRSSISGYTHFESLRDMVVLELLFATGVRVSELSNLTHDNIDLISGTVKVKGKGNKERIIQVCNIETLSILREYLQNLKSRHSQETEYFLINRFQKRLSEQSIRFVVKRIARTALIEKRVTPHVFRHSFATLLLEEDVDIKYIQHLLGHSSIMTTQIYTHVNGGKQREILLNKHPRKHFQMQEIPSG